MIKKLALILLTSSLLAACAPHKVVSSVVAAPFKIVGGTVDMLTTSQKEADLKRGRAMRKAEEREKKASKKLAEQERKEAKRQDDDWD